MGCLDGRTVWRHNILPTPMCCTWIWQRWSALHQVRLQLLYLEWSWTWRSLPSFMTIMAWNTGLLLRRTHFHILYYNFYSLQLALGSDMCKLMLLVVKRWRVLTNHFTLCFEQCTGWKNWVHHAERCRPAGKSAIVNYFTRRTWFTSSPSPQSPSVSRLFGRMCFSLLACSIIVITESKPWSALVCHRFIDEKVIYNHGRNT